jgi:hypothetical protein
MKSLWYESLMVEEKKKKKKSEPRQPAAAADGPNRRTRRARAWACLCTNSSEKNVQFVEILVRSQQ